MSLQNRKVEVREKDLRSISSAGSKILAEQGTMIYARAHDQTVADDYFTAMARVEQRLEIVPELKQEKEYEVVNVQEPTKVFQLIEQLEAPELCLEARLDIASQLRELFGVVQEFEPAMVLA